MILSFWPSKDPIRYELEPTTSKIFYFHVGSIGLFVLFMLAINFKINTTVTSSSLTGSQWVGQDPCSLKWRPRDHGPCITHVVFTNSLLTFLFDCVVIPFKVKDRSRWFIESLGLCVYHSLSTHPRCLSIWNLVLSQINKTDTLSVRNGPETPRPV